MRLMANSRPADGVNPGDINHLFEQSGFSSSAWDLVRHRHVTGYGIETGEVAGIVLIMEVESPDEAQDLLNSLPAVQHGLITFDVDPLGMSMGI